MADHRPGARVSVVAGRSRARTSTSRRVRPPAPSRPRCPTRAGVVPHTRGRPGPAPVGTCADGAVPTPSLEARRPRSRAPPGGRPPRSRASRGRAGVPCAKLVRGLQLSRSRAQPSGYGASAVRARLHDVRRSGSRARLLRTAIRQSRSSPAYGDPTDTLSPAHRGHGAPLLPADRRSDSRAQPRRRAVTVPRSSPAGGGHERRPVPDLRELPPTRP